MSRRRGQGAALALVAIVLLALGGCAETEFAAQTAKNLGRGDAARGVKIGKPYQIDGKWYRPRADDAYVEEGEASWYGRKFHGRPTANGERYDMNALTAAHKTLPLPSVVRVTNLENGRTLELRVNDRGPFAKGRIIDVSRRAAELLGFRGQGVARVRVEILPEKSRIAQGLAPKDVEMVATTADHQAPEATVRAAAAPPADAAFPARPAAAGEEAVDAGTWVQAGAFVAYPRAQRARGRLASVGPAVISKVTLGDADFYRVRIGPARSEAEAQRVLAQAISAGYPDARIVFD